MISTLPHEVLLDAALLVDSNFLEVIGARMADVCLRNLEYARFYPSQKLSLIRAKDGRVCSPWTIRGGKLTLDVMEVFVSALRSSCVEKLDFYGSKMSPTIVSLFLRERINAGQLNFEGVDFGQVTTSRFQEFLFHFSSSSVRFLNGCNFPAGQRLKDLGRVLSTRDVRLWRSSQGKWSVWCQEKECWQKSNEQ